MNWSIPQPVDDVTLAFPADTIGKLLPPMVDIPQEFKDRRNKWVKVVSKWMFKGVNKTHFTLNKGIDANMAFRQLQACIGSFEPKHEHKEAGCAYLMSLFFSDYNEQ